MDKDINIHFEDIYNPMVDAEDIVITENKIKNHKQNKQLLNKQTSTDVVDTFSCDILFNSLFNICCCCFLIYE
jgi:hypothetical protein